MNGIGVTGYIEDMEHIANGEYYVPGWKEDYFQLKHYRYIRNQIAHENYADEDNMCSDEDAVWIENFYKRIMVQSDPLALHYKATKPHLAGKISAPNIQSNQYIPSHSNTYKPIRKKVGLAVVMLLLAIAVVVLILFVLFS